MNLSEQIKPISYFKDNAAKATTEMTETRQPLIITQNDEATCVIQDIKSYEETKETMALLKILAIGRRQIEAGKLTPAREAFARLDRQLLK